MALYDAGGDVARLQYRLDREGIDYRCQHPHIIAGRLVQPGFVVMRASEYIATTHDETDTDVHGPNLLDLVAQLADDAKINSPVAVAMKGFAAKLEENALVRSVRQ